MTTDTGAIDLGVIDQADAAEITGVVAGFAVVTAVEMLCRFTNDVDAIVATGTITQVASVFKNRSTPAVGVVTVAAIIAGLDMKNRFTCRCIPVMTR